MLRLSPVHQDEMYVVVVGGDKGCERDGFVGPFNIAITEVNNRETEIKRLCRDVWQQITWNARLVILKERR